MLARKIGAGSVLALAAAFVTHAAVFGTSHAAGGDRASAFHAVFVAALGLAIAGAFLRSALGRPIAFARGDFTLPLALGPGALGVYSLVECSEGRAPLAGGIALLVGWALAALVSGCAARTIAAIATRSAALLRALVSHVARATAPAWCGRPRAARVAAGAFVHVRRFDRGPPLPG